MTSSVAVVLLLLPAIVLSDLVLPPGTVLDICKDVRCPEGFKCVERQPTSCIFLPCLNRAACIPKNPFGFPFEVKPVGSSKSADRVGQCPPPTGFGICAFTCARDSDCQSGQRCCTNGCGGTNCMTPV